MNSGSPKKPGADRQAPPPGFNTHPRKFGKYHVIRTGYNSKDDWYEKYAFEDYPGANTYHYENADGSTYYRYPDNSAYYTNNRGYEWYEPPPVCEPPKKLPSPPLTPVHLEEDIERVIAKLIEDLANLKLEETKLVVNLEEDSIGLNVKIKKRA